MSKVWKKRYRKLGRHNSRMILAFALPFVGPMSAVLPIEHVGIQLLGEGGSGISAVSIAASSVWGWDPDPSQADRNGFGQSWNSTANNVERWASGYNQTFLLLNETKLAGPKLKDVAVTVLDALMKIEGSSGKGRLTEEGARRWFAPLLSTSNHSVQELAKEAGRDCDAPMLDRLADIPLPENGDGIFENLHDFEDKAAMSVELKNIGSENHGWPGRIFVRKLLAEKASNENELKSFIKKRRDAYKKKAKAKIISADRDLTRLHGKFATIYAAGCLAIEYGIFPWTRNHLLWAILKCQADNVAFVDQGGEMQPQVSSEEKLKQFLQEREPAFIDFASYEEKLDSNSVYITHQSLI